jgi:hypothetical protein
MHLSQTIRKYLGWCPNAGTMRTTLPPLPTPPVTIHPEEPNGEVGAVNFTQDLIVFLGLYT